MVRSADGVGFPALLADLFEKNLADQLRAASIERGGAAIDVIVAGAAGGQLESRPGEMTSAPAVSRVLVVR